MAKTEKETTGFLSKSQITMLDHNHLISFFFPDKHFDFLSLYKSFQTKPHSTTHINPVLSKTPVHMWTEPHLKKHLKLST